MITINLLSPKQKEALDMRILYATLERLMIFMVVITLVITTILLGIKIRLTQNLSGIQSRQLLSSEYVTANTEIKQFNEVITRVDRLQNEVVPVSGLVEDIVRRTPSGVLISNLDFDRASGSLRISGLASTRDRFLQFTESLRGSPYLKSLDSPVSNLFLKADIKYSLSGVVKLEALNGAAVDSATTTAKP